MKNKPDKFPNVFVVTDHDGPLVSINDTEYTPDFAIEFANRIIEVAESCSVATIKPIQNLFSTIIDPKYQTIEIDEKTLQDFMILQHGGSSDVRKVVVDLIEFYADMDKELNIILLPDVLASRQSYTKFTAQFAQYIRNGQTHYSVVKVEYDRTTNRLGIFCRLSPIATNKKFMSTFRAALHQHPHFELDVADMPRSYQTNPALLRFIAKQEGKEIKIKFNATKVMILPK